MDSLQEGREESGAVERLTARFAELWAEQHRLAEKWGSVESSTAWAIAQRLAKMAKASGTGGQSAAEVLAILSTWLASGTAHVARCAKPKD